MRCRQTLKKERPNVTVVRGDGSGTVRLLAPRSAARTDCDSSDRAVRRIDRLVPDTTREALHHGTTRRRLRTDLRAPRRRTGRCARAGPPSRRSGTAIGPAGPGRRPATPTTGQVLPAPIAGILPGAARPRIGRPARPSPTRPADGLVPEPPAGKRAARTVLIVVRLSRRPLGPGPQRDIADPEWDSNTVDRGVSQWEAPLPAGTLVSPALTPRATGRSAVAPGGLTRSGPDALLADADAPSLALPSRPGVVRSVSPRAPWPGHRARVRECGRWAGTWCLPLEGPGRRRARGAPTAG